MHWYYYLLIGVLFFSLMAQFLVRSRFSKYDQVRARSGYTGAQAARRVLDENGLSAIHVERVSGTLSDHFSPREGVLRLSESTYDSASVSALSVSLHEVGHALQQRDRYPLNQVRASLVPVANIGSMLGPYIALIGFFIPGNAGMTMINVGIMLFAAAVLFYIVTLPVEFNASRRALKVLGQTGILAADELPYARKVLSAAALTYVAATSAALVNLLRLMLMARSRRR
ncbi:MAG: zinc metallopeptidase [Clostridiaceae bacterium]|jgi:Zn-dependent membrane protease YugP|nr:zinc metallopeptidase [Clostridiaceae bacterium]